METKQKTLAELISKFENGQERYHKSAMFHKVITSLLYGADELSIINDLLTANEDQQKAFEDYVKTDVRPMGVILTREAAELYAGQTKQSEPVSLFIGDNTTENNGYSKAPEPVSLEVEEAAKDYAKTCYDSHEGTFIAGAKWQSQQPASIAWLLPQEMRDLSLKYKDSNTALSAIQLAQSELRKRIIDPVEFAKKSFYEFLEWHKQQGFVAIKPGDFEQYLISKTKQHGRN